jgi:hypothetical protein
MVQKKEVAVSKPEQRERRGMTKTAMVFWKQGRQQAVRFIGTSLSLFTCSGSHSTFEEEGDRFVEVF